MKILSREKTPTTPRGNRLEELYRKVNTIISLSIIHMEVLCFIYVNGIFAGIITRFISYNRFHMSYNTVIIKVIIIIEVSN